MLIVDDDELILSLLTEELADDYDIVGARQRGDVAQALRQLGRSPAYALIDLGLPPHVNNPREGFALVRELIATAPGCAVIVVSGQNEDDHGKIARTLGALDYISKPCDSETIRTALTRARSTQAAVANQSALIGNSAPIMRLQQQVRQFASAPYPVLLEGESGTGKEIAARALHAESGRTGKFMAINCAAMPEHLFEASLFGARRGAYTGAVADMPGHLHAAAGGTLFLDEIGEMPLQLQPKLLRLLENGDYLRIGDAEPSQADIRLLAATNRPLRTATSAGTFREDLYHRLSVLIITTPPLRELGDDCLMLLEHFRAQAATRAGTDEFTLDQEAIALWRNYNFPGNVRELRNIAARLQVTHPGMEVDAEMLSTELLNTPLQDDIVSLDEILTATARMHARDALAATGDIVTAAKKLGVTPMRLRTLLDSPDNKHD